MTLNHVAYATGEVRDASEVAAIAKRWIGRVDEPTTGRYKRVVPGIIIDASRVSWRAT